jgi:hypothetical protein
MNGLGPVEIGARLHRTESTIRSFLKSYEKSRAIFLSEADLRFRRYRILRLTILRGIILTLRRVS